MIGTLASRADRATWTIDYVEALGYNLLYVSVSSLTETAFLKRKGIL